MLLQLRSSNYVCLLAVQLDEEASLDTISKFCVKIESKKK